MALVLVPDDSITLARARAMFHEECKVGTHCPCCSRFCKVYANKLTKGDLKLLAYLYRCDLDGTFSVSRQIEAGIRDRSLNQLSGNVTRLALHGFLSEVHQMKYKDDGDPMLDASGEPIVTRVWNCWQINEERTIKFLRGQLKLPRCRFTLNGTLTPEQDDADLVGLEDVVKQEFDRNEIIHELDFLEAS